MLQLTYLTTSRLTCPVTCITTLTLKAIKNRIKRQENGVNPRRDSRASTDHEDDDEDELEEEEEEEEEEDDGGMRVSLHHHQSCILIISVTSIHINMLKFLTFLAFRDIFVSEGNPHGSLDLLFYYLLGIVMILTLP